MKIDTRTWVIIGLAAALLATILAVPTLRENVATWLVWLGGLLGAGVHEVGRRSLQEPPEEVEPETAADGLSESIDEATADEEGASGDGLHEDWEELGQ